MNAQSGLTGMPGGYRGWSWRVLEELRFLMLPIDPDTVRSVANEII